MFRELPASRPVRSFRRGEWTGIIGASVFHAALLMLGATPSPAPVEIPARDTIPIVFTSKRSPASERVDPPQPTSAEPSFVSPSPIDWPDGAIPEFDLDPNAIELPPSVTPGDMFKSTARSGELWAGLSAGGVAGGGGLAPESALDLPLRVERAPEPRYPEWLRRAGITGGVTVEFVVDTTGRVETASIAVIHATREEFAEAVIRALEGARFSPGMVRGRRVRVKVSQDFLFRMRP